ncbi:MAG: metal-dependent phosphohydrolase [Acidimicrobiia bacterium]|nr:metal-dependent phosphohydrolase [Acidimicrobiia bacterium]
MRDELLAAYGEPHRRYHGTAHLEMVLRVLDELHAPGRPTAAARAALWFHDAVYDARRGDNEAASAALARARLGALGVAADEVERIAALVEATAEHVEVPVPGAAELLDADLSVLGAERPAYEAYVAGVRAEYGHLDDESFRRGRAAVLRRLAERPQLFRSERGRASFDASARANLAQELRRLDAPPAPADC